MDTEHTNIDNYLDYADIYKSIVKKAKVTGDQLFGLCPVHQDTNPSFSVNLKTGTCQCFSCGFKGNYVSLYAHLNGIDQKEAFKRICEEHNINCGSGTVVTAKKEKEERLVYTLQEYSQEKNLPLEYLTTIWGLSDKKNAKSSSVQIPYYSLEGKVQAIRYRNSPKAKQRFYWRRGDHTALYGMQFLKDALENNRPIILVEGESDTQTLTYLGFDAIGLAGASTFKSEEVSIFSGAKLYIHVENDMGGETFIRTVTDRLRENKFDGQVFRFSCSEAGCKDPSALYLKEGKKASGIIQGLMEKAKKVDFMHEDIPESVKGAPINLRIPNGYIANDGGIFKVNNEGIMTLICRTPILIAKRLISYDAKEEKIQILFKRDGRFTGGVFDRKTIFNNTSILELSAMGATISSANAKAVVSYLTELEAENLDLLPVSYSSKTLGWLPSGQFLPYHAEDVELDVHGSLAQWSGSCVRKGSLERWIEIMKPHRDRYRFRFILSASFTAPLLKILKVRSFIVYNWADSRGGKTACLKASLSAWGDPERMMITFNSTKVALERMATFFCDIPLGIDERQLAGSNQEGLETIFYMLANGTSRGRGTRDGGIQEINTWRTVALTTGEEPVQTERTMTGVATRTIEIVGAPFENEIQASQMHQDCSDNTGEAGYAFIDYILKTDKKEIIAKYNQFFSEIEKMVGGNGSHIACIASVATADYLASISIFGEDKNQAQDKAIDMVKNIVSDMKKNCLPDVNISACNYILDFFNANKDKFFNEDNLQTVYGWENSFQKKIFFYPSYLKKTLEEGGYSYRKTLDFLRSNKIVDTDAKGNYSVLVKHNNKTLRVIGINEQALDEITGRAKAKTETEQLELDIKEGDEELPF